MIDTTIEHVVSMGQAADELPRRRRGRKTNVSTLYRWTKSDCRGVLLEYIQIGATRCTSREAIQRFFEQLSKGRTEATPSGVLGRSRAQRQRQSAKAGANHEQMGA
jgi:Protein of unknown function (DUF1580)